MIKNKLKYTEDEVEGIRTDAHFNGCIAGIMIGVFATLMVIAFTGAMNNNQCYFDEYQFVDNTNKIITCEIGDKFNCGYNLYDCTDGKDYECVINVEFKSGYRECSG